jgi:putative transcriptional regulator
MEIQKIRKQLKITQYQFAERLGVARATVNRWEQGHTKPSRLALDKINELVNGNSLKTIDNKGDNQQ